MTGVFKTEKSIPSRKSIGGERFGRVKASILLAVILFATACQTVHYHAGNSVNFAVSRRSNEAKTPAAFAAVDEAGNQDDCLVCQLKRQVSVVRVFRAPDVVLSVQAKTDNVVVFFSATHYRSAEHSSVGARGPPLQPFFS